MKGRLGGKKFGIIQIFKSAFFTILSVMLVPMVLAQTPAQHGMTKSSGNFKTFSGNINTFDTETWMSLNDELYHDHPEFGIKPKYAPTEDLVEVLAMRTANERYFVNPNNPSEFFKQTSHGDLHYMSGGRWLTIDPSLSPLSEHHYAATSQPEPVGIHTQQQLSYIETVNGRVEFNKWELYGINQNTSTLLSVADWSNYTAGDDGVYIHNIFEGIDLKMRVLQGAIKSEFIVRAFPYGEYQFVQFRDRFSSPLKSLMIDTAHDSVNVIDEHGKPLVNIGDAIVYPQSAKREEMFIAPYAILKNQLNINVPYQWLKEKLATDVVIIDPLVSSNNTMGVSAITGSQYNASCNFVNSCNYNMTVNTPADATITDILFSFAYEAIGMCWLEDGAMRYAFNSCVSPNGSTTWTCDDWGPGTCTGVNISLASHFSTCMNALTPSCSPQPLNFEMRFYRTCYGDPGCNGSCIRAYQPWIMTVRGYTVQFTSTNPTQQITLSSTNVCPGASVTATANIQYGVPPYNINWSLNSSGTPSIGSGTTITTSFENPGVSTIYCFITDACGNSISSNRNITVTNPSAGPNVTSPVNYCINATATALTASGSGLKWYDVATGGTELGAAPVPNTSTTGTTSYWVSQTVGGCESQRSQIDVVVHPSPTVTGTPTITPSECNGSTGSISGLTTNATGTITYTWYNASGTVVSTSTTSSTLSNQPAGEYSLTITDGYGCQGTQSGYIIPVEAAPAPPVVASPVHYCQLDETTPLTATGSSLTWYASASLTDGSSTPPTPSSNAAGTTTYYVTQTINGCESSAATITVNVTAKPSPPTVTSPLMYCQADTPAPLEANGTDLLWYSTPTGGTGSPTAPVLSTSNYGTQYIYVSQSINGCESERAVIEAEIIALPTFTGNLQVTPSACGQATGSISGVFAEPGNSQLLNFQWHNENGDWVAGSLSLINQPSGYYTLTAIGQNNCSASYGPVFIPLTAIPAGPLAPSPVEYCQGYTAIPLTANGTDLLWYTTESGGTPSTTAPIPSTDTVGSTTYYVSQTVDGCESERTEIVVNVLDAPGAEFHTNGQTGCSPFCAAFENLSTPTGAPLVAYEWKANGSIFSNDVNPTHCFPAGTYTIELKIRDAVGCTKTVSKTDYITVLPATISEFTADKYEAPEDNSTIHFKTVNPRPNETVEWNFGDGNTATGYLASNTFPGPGQYCVTHTVSSSYGCSDRSEKCVIITSQFNLYIPNSFTPDGDGINDVWKPVIRGKFTKYSLQIYNRWGERVFFTDNPEIPWIGEVQDGDYYFTSDGMYHYILLIEDELAMPKEYRGHIYLLR